MSDDADRRWRLPTAPVTGPVPVVKRRVDPPAALVNGGDDREYEPQHLEAPADPDPVVMAAGLESPDVTARFAVAQLTELNDRVEELTKLATETTAGSLEQVYNELHRLTSMREVDLTDQAAGIFGAVEAGTAALERFAEVVREVTDDLRAILSDSLAAIGGTAGLADAIITAQADVAGVREDFGAALARIERDLSVMRQRLPAKGAAPAAPKITDDQLALIIDAVTEAVVGTLNEGRSRRR